MRENRGFVFEKICQMVIALFALSFIVFVIARMCPGDPLLAYYGDGIEHMSAEQKMIAEENLGLNRPVLVQYVDWINNAAHGNLGISYKYKMPVAEVISRVWLNTLILGGISYVLTFVLSTLLGAFCAMHEEEPVDKIICKLGIVSGSIPSFFLALMMLLIFSVVLNIFPTGGAYSYGRSSDIADRAVHLVLPVAVMVLEHLWYYAYMVRNMLIAEKREDYVLLCKAMGFSSNKILYGHCLRNIIPSLLAIMAISLPHIIGGTYVVEMVFAYPGLGKLSFEAAMYKDYNMLMALTMITGAIVVFFSILAQIISELVDPRMKREVALNE